MEVVSGDNWTTGAKSCKALVKSSPPRNQHPVFFTGRMPFLSPNQQCQSTKGKNITFPQAHLGVFQLCLWPLIAPGYLGEVCHACHQPSDASNDNVICKIELLMVTQQWSEDCYNKNLATEHVRHTSASSWTCWARYDVSWWLTTAHSSPCASATHRRTGLGGKGHYQYCNSRHNGCVGVVRNYWCIHLLLAFARYYWLKYILRKSQPMLLLHKID